MVWRWQGQEVCVELSAYRESWAFCGDPANRNQTHPLCALWAETGGEDDVPEEPVPQSDINKNSDI